MNAGSLLAWLYPPAVRERWGTDISREVSGAGARSWPDTLVGAFRLWVHPGDWPETEPGQTRRVVTVMLFVLAATAALLLRSAEPTSTLTADTDHPVTSLWLVPVLLGVVLAAPLPMLRRRPFGRLLAEAVRSLAAPAVTVGLLLALAWSGVLERATGAADIALAVYYWLTLTFVALGLCTFVSRATLTSTPPTARRASTALLCLGVGLIIAAAQNLWPDFRAGQHPAYLPQTVVLVFLAGVALSAARNLHVRPAAQP